MTDDVVAFGGRVISGAELDALFERAESGGELAGGPGLVRVGRPLSVGCETAVPFSIRLDSSRRSKIEVRAKERGTSASQVVRELIDAM